MTTALICGVTGQDGAYLAASLLGRGYRVVGTSRDAATGSFANLASLGIQGQIEVASMAPTDFRSVAATFTRAQPDEVYHLAGQSSVGLSFEQPAESLESVVFGTLNLLEAIRMFRPAARFYHASSSECFGDRGDRPATESTPFHPRSPYGVAKASAHMLVANYREAYGLFAVNGLLFNHESPLRPERFVTRKVTAAAARIAAGSDERLRLGRIDIRRDWGWAPEYVEAMVAMLHTEAPEDFVVATGRSVPLAHFVETAFAALDLDWRDHVDSDTAFARPSDLECSAADPARARDRLGWQATIGVEEVAWRMALADRDLLSAGAP